MANDIQKMTALEAAEVLKTSSDVKLVDVRTDQEREIAQIDGAFHLSRENADECIHNWSRDQQIIFHCHHGIRSLGAASHFLENGFSNVVNLEGGIDAWSVDVDSSVERY